MDIAQASVDLKQAEVQQQVGMAVMRMAMENAQVQGSAVNRLVAQQAAPVVQDPALGNLVDVSA